MGESPAMDLKPAGLDLAELLERHRAALGGLDALRRTAIRRTASSRRSVTDWWMVEVSDALSGRFLRESHALGQGHLIREAFDGSASWIETPFYEGYLPANHAWHVDNLVLVRPLWAEGIDAPLGARLRGIGVATSGRSCFVVERSFTNAARQQIRVVHRLDCQSFLVCEEHEGDTLTTFGAYRDVGGVLVPFEMELRGALDWWRVEVRYVEVLAAFPSLERPDFHVPRPAATDNLNVQSLDVLRWTYDNLHPDKPDIGAAMEAARDAVAAVEDGGQAFVDIATRVIRELRISHSAILPSAQTRTGEDRPAQPGRYGIHVRWIDDAPTVWRIRTGSPAASSALRPGDVICSLNGLDHDALCAKHVLSHVHNDLTRKVRPYELEMSVLTGDRLVVEYLDHDDWRGKLEMVATETPLYGLQFESTWRDDVLVMGWAQFWWDLRDRLESALVDARRARGLVLDLRGNSGGALVTEVVSCFVDSPSPIGRYVYHRRDVVPMAAGRRDAYLGRLAVLVDERSASSAEILAAVLRELGRARVFGRRTVAAVLTSNSVVLPNGCQAKFVISRYRTPAGHSLEGVGVVPDEVVTVTRKDLVHGRDPDMEAALAWLGRD